MIKKAGDIIANYFKSFNNEPEGYSRTKLVAYAFAAITMVIEWAWLTSCIISGDWSNLMEILILNVSTIMTLLGLKMHFKNKKIKEDGQDKAQ